MKKSLITLVAIFSTCSLIAQDSSKQDTSNIATEKVEVIKNYEAIIQQAQKKNIDLNYAPKAPLVINYKYDIQSEAKLDFERPEERIRPLSYKHENAFKDIKDGSVYGGYGTYKSLNAGAAYHYYIEDWLEAGFRFDHFSAADKDLAFQKYNTNNGQLYASYFLSKKTKVGLEAKYNSFDHYTETNFIGDSLPGISQQPVDQLGIALNFSTISFENLGMALRTRAGIESTEQKEDESKENRLFAELNLIKKFSDNISFEIPLEYNKYDYTVSDSINEINTKDFQLSPQVRFKGDAYNAKAGLQYINADDTSFIFTVLDIYVSDIFNVLDLQFYTSSSFARNGMSHLLSINPYYRTDLSQYTPYFSASYNLKAIKSYNNWKFNLNFAYTDYTGDAIFFDRAESNRAIMNSLDRNEISITPSIDYNYCAIAFSMSYDHNIFLDNTGNLAFYRPKSILNITGSQKLLNDKLSLGQSVSYVSSRKTSHPSDEDRLLDAFFDLSLDAEFLVSKSVSIYLRGSNLLGQDYELWYGHPVFKRQVWGGLRINI